jgi:hypothetical protein
MSRTSEIQGYVKDMLSDVRSTSPSVSVVFTLNKPIGSVTARRI